MTAEQAEALVRARRSRIWRVWIAPGVQSARLTWAEVITCSP